MGRIVIPIRLREQYGFEIGKEYEFYLHTIKNGENFLCLHCPTSMDRSTIAAIDLLEQQGYDVTPGRY